MLPEGSQQPELAGYTLSSPNNDGIGSAKQSPAAETIASYENTRRAARDELVGQFLVLNYGMEYASNCSLTFMKAEPLKPFVLEGRENKSVQRSREYVQ